MTRTIVPTLCRMCNDRCAINVVREGNRVVEVTGVAGHPWNRGRICAKGRYSPDFVHAPDRILHPLKKVGGDWREIGLDEALDEIADRLKKVQRDEGTRSIGIWKGEGVGFAQQEGLVRRFCHALGTPNYFSNDSTCFCSRYMGYAAVYGVGLVPDFDQSQCVTIWGSNPPFSHPFQYEKILGAQKRGGRLIVVDPKRSEIAARADLHVRPRPGTDGALAWGIVRHLVTEKLFDQDFVRDYCLGFDEVADYCLAYTDEVVERETGVEAGLVAQVAKTMAGGAPRSLIYAGNGLEHHRHGTENIRAIALIDALLGCVDRPGGNRLPDPLPLNGLTLYDELPLEQAEPLGARTYPLLYEVNHECHTMSGIDAILTGRPYPLKAMILTAANPALSHPRSDKVRRALNQLDLFVVRDLFLTETARLADFVLPAASFLERSELHVNPTYNVVNLTSKVITLPDCQDEYQFWHDLAHRLDIGGYFPWPDEPALNRWLLKYAGFQDSEVEAHPEGYPFRPLQYEKWRTLFFKTPSGKIELAVPRWEHLGYNRIPKYPLSPSPRTPDPQYPLLMVSGSRQKYHVGTRYHNLSALEAKEPEPWALVHRDDARRAGITDGGTITVNSAYGEISLRARLGGDAELQPGFIHVPSGWPQVNVNDLTPDDLNDPISGFPELKAVAVRIRT